MASPWYGGCGLARNNQDRVSVQYQLSIQTYDRTSGSRDRHSAAQRPPAGRSSAGAKAWAITWVLASNVSFSKLRIYTGGGGHLFIRLPTAASLVTGSYVSTANLT